MAPSTTGRYKIRSITRATGFSPSLLRAWELRYNLLRPERTGTGHRLYSEQDLALLQAVKGLIEQGRSIGEIARMGRDALLEAAPSPVPARSFSSLEKHAEQLVQASVEMDGGRLEEHLNHAFTLLSPALVIERIIEPAAIAIGELWAQGGCSVASEHLFSEAVGNRLRRILELNGRPAGGMLCLCACFPDESHELGLLSLSHALVRAGARTIYLGPSLPFEDLVIACRKLRPRVAMLSVTRRALFEAHRPQLLTRVQQVDAQIAIGGQGVPDQDDELSSAGIRIIRGHPWRSNAVSELLSSLR